MLLCTDGRKVDVDSWETCNWGKIASHVVMTSNSRSQETRANYKDFLTLLSLDFGEEGIHKNLFELFKSSKYGKQNLIFTDETKALKDISQVAGGTRSSYYSWTVISSLQSTSGFAQINIELCTGQMTSFFKYHFRDGSQK